MRWPLDTGMSNQTEALEMSELVDNSDDLVWVTLGPPKETLCIDASYS